MDVQLNTTGTPLRGGEEKPVQKPEDERMQEIAKSMEVKKSPGCLTCSVKLNFTEKQLPCTKCSQIFCAKHRLPEAHACTHKDSKKQTNSPTARSYGSFHEGGSSSSVF